MSFGAELRVYLISLKCCGLLCITHDSSDPYETYATSADQTLALVALLVAQMGAWLAFAHIWMMSESFRLPIYGRVGNTYLLINYGIACLVISLVYLYFYVKRGSLLKLLSMLLYHNRRELENCFATRFLVRFCVYVGLSSLCAFIYSKAFFQSDIPMLPCVLLSIVFTYSYMLIGLITALYSCLTQVLAALLHLYNQDLRAATTTASTLTASTTTTTLWRLGLWQRNQLLIVCHEQLNFDLGLVMALITAYLLLSAPGAPFFLVTIVFELDASEEGISYYLFALFITLLWNIPYIVAMLMILQTDVVKKEANKTAKILAKIPRTGSGLDRMVEKFLLKNLRQQPILTAYGFFALDKSTLFNLFTAIFTYMVILVQFKEMENSTKSLQQA